MKFLLLVFLVNLSAPSTDPEGAQLLTKQFATAQECQSEAARISQAAPKSFDVAVRYFCVDRTKI